VYAIPADARVIDEIPITPDWSPSPCLGDMAAGSDIQ